MAEDDQHGAPTDASSDAAQQAAIEGVSAAFASLGRVFLCVDTGFRVLHASSLLDRLIGRGAAEAAAGDPSRTCWGRSCSGPRAPCASCCWRASVARDGARC